MAPPAVSKLEFRGLSKHFGGVRVFDDVTFIAPAGGITALIGPNGAGKSTLINITCGVLPSTDGFVLKDGQSLAGIRPSGALTRSIARTYQDVRVFPTLTVLENVMVARRDQPGDRPWRLLGAAWRAAEERNRAEALRLLEQLDLTSDKDRRAEDVPFGTQKLIALARATATGADTLMLDETTTGLEISRVPLAMEFMRELRRAGRTVVLVEHNMDVVSDIADHVVVLHGTVIAEGSAHAVLREESVIRDYLGRIYNA